MSDPEDVARVLDYEFDILVDVLNRIGGTLTINKPIMIVCDKSE